MGYCIPMTRFSGTRLSLALALMGHLACSNAAVDKAVGATDGAATVVVAQTDARGSASRSTAMPLLRTVPRRRRTRDGACFSTRSPTLDAGVTHEVKFAGFPHRRGCAVRAGVHRAHAGENDRPRHAGQQVQRDDAVGARASGTVVPPIRLQCQGSSPHRSTAVATATSGPEPSLSSPALTARAAAAKPR